MRNSTIAAWAIAAVENLRRTDARAHAARRGADGGAQLAIDVVAVGECESLGGA